LLIDLSDVLKHPLDLAGVLNEAEFRELLDLDALDDASLSRADRRPA